MCQHSAGLAFHQQRHELANLRLGESGMQGVNDPRDIGRRDIRVDFRYSRDHLVNLHGFVRLRHRRIFN